MALTKAAPQNEKEVTWALQARLRDFIQPSESLHHPLTDVYRLKHTQAVYVVGLGDLLKSGLEGAKLNCWRYLAGSSLGHAAGGEVSFLGSGNTTPILNGLLYGPEVTVFVQSADRFLSQYWETYDGYADNYELRILSIPGLLVEAFWLKCSPAQGDTASSAGAGKAAAAPDHLIPFLSGSRRLELMRDYPIDEFLKIVAEPAAARLKSGEVSDVKPDDRDVLTNYRRE
jgi:hypothetical protein